jgi:hypothetical protein
VTDAPQTVSNSPSLGDACFSMLEITLTLGSHSRRVDGRELVAAMRISPTLATLVRLATGWSDAAVVHGEGRVRDGRGLPGPNADADRNSLGAFSVGRGLGEPTVAAPVDKIAVHLADALLDRRSLRWYRMVAARVPPDVVRDALARALDLAPENVRRSRAALFTSLVRPYLAPYAHPPSDPS